MPNTKHAFFLGLIAEKFPSLFNAVLGERYTEWKTEFYRLYKCESIEEFEIGWQEMVEHYGLQTNRDIANLFAFRSHWAFSYLKGHFFARFCWAGMSKFMNAFIQRFLSAQTQLGQFVEQVMPCISLFFFFFCWFTKPSHTFGCWFWISMKQLWRWFFELVQNKDNCVFFWLAYCDIMLCASCKWPKYVKCYVQVSFANTLNFNFFFCFSFSTLTYRNNL